MIESQQVLEWIAMGEAEGWVKGWAKGWAEALLIILAGRFPPGATPEMAAVIHAIVDMERLESWVDLAATTNSLDAFRQAAGL